jgi:hypothetical protein
MIDRPVKILTATQVFADLVDYCQVEGQGCVDDGRTLSMDRLRFYAAVDDHGSGDQGGAECAARVYLDADIARLRTFAHNGWRTLWFNPTGQIAPDFVPAHDGELATMGDLWEIPALLMKPTLKTCVDWMDVWALPENIRCHVRLVARLAYGLGVLLRRTGEPVDPILAHRGGLLHDLDKLHTLDGTQRHGGMAAAFLREQGQTDLAEIVRGHILGSVLEDQTDLRTWEARLVFFCDKLVEQDRIVPFDERITALKARYPGFRGIMDQAEPYVWALNDHICSKLSIPNHENLISFLKEL